MAVIATRNGEPAYKDAPERTRAPSKPFDPVVFNDGWAIAFGTALAGFALRPLRRLRRSGACRYRGGLR